MADTKFIEENKEVLIDEMAQTISKMNSIISSVLQTPITPEVDGSVMRTYFMAQAMQIGSLTSLFNQYYVLLKGAIPKENRPVGFASLIKSASTKVALPPTMGGVEESDAPEEE